MVLGDMKQEKSTFLNALIGENILPSDVNPCTAILTILRYGLEKKVTVYFDDDAEPEVIDFKSFKTRYTIDPAEAELKLKRVFKANLAEYCQTEVETCTAIASFPSARCWLCVNGLKTTMPI